MGNLHDAIAAAYGGGEGAPPPKSSLHDAIAQAYGGDKPSEDDSDGALSRAAGFFQGADVTGVGGKLTEKLLEAQHDIPPELTRAILEKNATNHPMLGALGEGATMAAQPIPGGSAARIVGSGLFQGGAATMKAGLQDKPMLPAAVRGTGAGLVGGAGGEVLGKLAGAFGSKPMGQLGDRAAELLAQNPSLGPAAVDAAKAEMVSGANQSIKQGLGNMAAGGVKMAAGTMLGPMGKLVGAASGGPQMLSAAKQIALGIIKRPAIIKQIAKVEPYGELIGRAASGGADRLTSLLFGISKAAPLDFQRIQKQLESSWNDSDSPIGYRGATQ